MHYRQFKMNETESGSTSLSTSALAQNGGSWTCRMSQCWGPSTHTCFFHSELTSMELGTKTPTGSWHTQAISCTSIQPQPHFQMWASKCQRGAAGGSLQSRSEVISSKEFCYININSKILMYLRYFQFEMIGKSQFKVCQQPLSLN